jgi:hypothetical protein
MPLQDCKNYTYYFSESLKLPIPNIYIHELYISHLHSNKDLSQSKYEKEKGPKKN